MTRKQLEDLTGELGRAVAGALNDDKKPGEPKTGFVLLLFDFGEEGSFAYAANAVRADVVKFLKEAREKIAGATQ